MTPPVAERVLETVAFAYLVAVAAAAATLLLVGELLNRFPGVEVSAHSDLVVWLFDSASRPFDFLPPVGPTAPDGG